MAEWPSTAELALIVNVSNADSDHADTFNRARQSAIDYVKLRRGNWIEGTDAPDEMLASAALRMAVLLLLAPGQGPDELASDPTFTNSMYGHRQRFGIA